MVQLKHRCRSFIVGPPTCCGVLDPYCGPGEGSGAQRTHEPSHGRLWWLLVNGFTLRIGPRWCAGFGFGIGWLSHIDYLYAIPDPRGRLNRRVRLRPDLKLATELLRAAQVEVLRIDDECVPVSTR